MEQEDIFARFVGSQVFIAEFVRRVAIVFQLPMGLQSLLFVGVGETMKNKNVLSPHLILVDSLDNPIGEEEVIIAHLGEGKRHRAISVFLYNKKGNLLLQQRSKEKMVGALQWANTCCGNVRVGETTTECALRRLKEELGITDVKITPLYKFEYHISCNEKFSEWEIDQVFVGRYDRAPKPNPHEVEQVDWKSSAKIRDEIRENATIYTPWFRLMMQDKRITAYDQFRKIHKNNKKEDICDR